MQRRRGLLLAACAAVIGLIMSLYLVWLHYKVHTDPGYHSYCAMSDAFNCETVAESQYAVFLRLPVAAWGTFGYLLLLTVIGGSLRHGPSPLRTLSGLAFSVAAVAASIALAVISYCVICAFCVLCTATYVVNLALLGIFVRETSRTRPSFAAARRELAGLVRRRWPMLAGLLLFLAVLILVYPPYWQHSIDSEPLQHEGLTAAGSHWLGGREPLLTVVEYSDYLCPHCERGHLTMRRLLAENPEKLRVVHRHFPLDEACNPLITSPFHPGACLLARAAYCAGEQGRFWEMNDILYQHESLPGGSWEERAAAAAGRLELERVPFEKCLNSPAAHESVQADISSALELGISGTPAFVVNGRVYPGTIPAAVLKAAGIERPAR